MTKLYKRELTREQKKAVIEKMKYPFQAISPMDKVDLLNDILEGSSEKNISKKYRIKQRDIDLIKNEIIEVRFSVWIKIIQ